MRKDQPGILVGIIFLVFMVGVVLYNLLPALARTEANTTAHIYVTCRIERNCMESEVVTGSQWEIHDTYIKVTTKHKQVLVPWYNIAKVEIEEE